MDVKFSFDTVGSHSGDSLTDLWICLTQTQWDQVRRIYLDWSVVDLFAGEYSCQICGPEFRIHATDLKYSIALQ